MVNKLLDAVSKQLGTHFGVNYTYYVENVKQELRKPCFTIDMVDALARSRNATMYDRTMPIVVHYFSGNNVTTKKDAYAKAEEIMDVLEYLPYEGGLLRAENIHWHIVSDDVLQVFMTYTFRTKRVTEEIAMEELLQNFR